VHKVLQSKNPGTTLPFLFVYGTLLSNAKDSLGAMMRERLRRETSFVDHASVPGQLFDLGDYPGMVEASLRERHTVLGEVRRLDNPGTTLAWVDTYEDVNVDAPSRGPYRRAPQLALLDRGDTLRCWAYVLNEVPAIDNLIPSGCWLSHYASR